MIYIDFETRSRLDIKETGAWKYSLDASTEILCMAWALDDGEVQLYLPGTSERPPWAKDLESFKAHGGVIEAHNAGFEQAIYYNILVRRFGWPDIDRFAWRDSMAQAAAHALPLSLEKCGKALSLSNVKDTEGRLIMLQLSKPRAPTKTNPKEWMEKEDYPEKYERLYSYCMDDVRCERSISKTLPPLTKREQWLWLLDQRINQRGVTCDVDLARKALRIIDQHQEWGVERIKELTGGEITSHSQVIKLKDWVTAQGVTNCPDVRKDTVSKLLSDSKNIPEKVKEVLEIRQALGRSSTKKLEAMISAATPDNKVRYSLLYHGTTTGRWAGRLIQVQNFPRGNPNIDADEVLADLACMDYVQFRSKYSDPLDAISTALRGFIMASPKKHLVAADFNAIEARVLLWFAKEWAALEMFKNGQDIYKDMAAFIYSIPVEEVDKNQRQLGKQAVLGAGFQMGPSKFQMTCQSYGMDVSMELAKKAIYAYREKFPGVPRFWRDTEQAAIEATINPGKRIEVSGTCWVYDKRSNFLYCYLPSGRPLAYYDPAIRMKEFTVYDRNTGKPKVKTAPQLTYMGMSSSTLWERQETYGGHLVENIVQGTARDCLVEGMFRVEKTKKFLTIMTVHDEIVCEIDENLEEPTLKEFESLLSISPDWALDLPIKAEGWRGLRYRK